MQVRFYANMRTIAGQEVYEATEQHDGMTLRELFTHLTSRFPALQPHLFDEHGGLRQDMPIFVNGRNPRLFGAMDAAIPADAVISLFSPIASGKMNVEVLRE